MSKPVIARSKAVAALCFVFMLAGVSTAHATEITVNSIADTTANDGVCTLREAIKAAKDAAASGAATGECPAGSGTDDTIKFGLSGTILLTAPLVISQNKLTIDGSGQSIAVDGQNPPAGTTGVRVFVVNPGAVAILNALTIQNGYGPDSTIQGGGGIHNSGTVTVTNSTLTGNNAAYGGAILGGGFVTVRNSTIVGNRAELGSAVIIAGDMTVTNSTIANNVATQASGGAFGNFAAYVTLSNSIVANNTNGNCDYGPSSPGANDGSVFDGGYNVSDDATCGFPIASSRNNTNPGLDTDGLKNNGGPTSTIALVAGSEAVDKGSCPGETSDQRGYSRPAGSACDIGAYELDGVAPSAQFTLTVGKSGTGSGTVSSNPAGISCGIDCTENYNENTSVVLTAAAGSGSNFTGWSGACSNLTGTCTVTMDQARSVTAGFAGPNVAPVINSTAPPTAIEDTLYTYGATRTDADGPGQTWSLFTGHSCGGSIGTSTGVFTFTPVGPTPPASCVAAVQVCDGGTPNLCATQTTTVTIAGDNDKPVITSTASTTATVATLYTYDANAASSDGPTETWSLAPAHTCGGSIVAATGVFSFTPAGPTPPASCVVAVQVCDGTTPTTQCATQTTTVTITTNIAPTITSTAPATATVGTLYTYDAAMLDPDGPSEIWSLHPMHTCGGSIVDMTGVFTVTPMGPTPPPSCLLYVLVCDGGIPNRCAEQSSIVTISSTPTAPVYSVSPLSLNFGSVSVGSSAGPTNVTITNTGSANLTISSVTPSGSTADYSVVSTSCTSAPVVPTGTCTITVTFTPTDSGSRDLTLSIATNAAGNPHSYSITGTGASTTGGTSCPSDPKTGCAVFMLGSLLFENQAKNANDRLSLSAQPGKSPSSPALFNAFTLKTGGSLCIYDSVGLIGEHVVAPGGTDSKGKALWSLGKNGKVGYNNPPGNNVGIKLLSRTPGIKGEFAGEGKGINLRLPTLPLRNLPLRVQNQVGDGTCGEISFGAETVKKNTSNTLNMKKVAAPTRR